MDWSIINARKREEQENPTRDLFSTLTLKYEKKKRGATSFASEQRELISKLINRTIPQVCGLTKNWTYDELCEIRLKAESFKPNPAAFFWKLAKEHNNKIKIQLKELESKTNK